MEPALFVKSREEFAALLTTVDNQIEQNKLKKVKETIKNGSSFIKRLRRATDDVIQLRSVSNLDLEIKIRQKRIANILSKRLAAKKVSILSRKSAIKKKHTTVLFHGKIHDGNVAIKCNWNDRGYKAPCSKVGWKINIDNKRSWCSSTLCNCREYDDEVNIADHPCYESIALKDMRFGAGWEHKSGGRDRPKRICSVKKNRAAILTTIPPEKEEADRLVIGVLYINEVIDRPGKETIIIGEKNKSFAVQFKRIKVRFWDYYKNPVAKNKIIWKSNLFRYVSNRTVVSILKGLSTQYSKQQKNRDKIINMIKYYEKIKG
jgi:hypothetical protein